MSSDNPQALETALSGLNEAIKVVKGSLDNPKGQSAAGLIQDEETLHNLEARRDQITQDDPGAPGPG